MRDWRIRGVSYPPPREEGWPRSGRRAGPRASPIGRSHQEKVVAHKSRFGVSDQPVCGAKVGFAEIFLMPSHPSSRGGEWGRTDIKAKDDR
jgi:hypothetical protein